MFSGIIEQVAQVLTIEQNGSNKTFTLQAELAREFKVDQSVSHNGVCLTVEEIQGNSYKVTAVEETLLKSNLGNWQTGNLVNLERSITLQTRLDGHIVQGHVDGLGEIEAIDNKEGSWLVTVFFPKEFQNLLVEKGSITLNGTSLTVYNIKDNTFQVAIIPYTWQHTSIKQAKVGDTVNLEFDVIGKYVARNMENYRK